MAKYGGQGWECVLLLLQSTKGHMHAKRTLDIGRHKQPVMDIYIDHISKNKLVLANEQAGSSKITIMQCGHDTQWQRPHSYNSNYGR